MERFLIAKKSCVVLKWDKDTRFSQKEVISTHNDRHYPCISCASDQLMTYLPKIQDYDVIGIDEGQFFENLAEFCDTLAFKGKKIVVSGLDADFRREPFPEITKLIPRAESVLKLTAVCTGCGNSASFSQRITKNTEIELVGGAEIYRAVCRNCYASLSDNA